MKKVYISPLILDANGTITLRASQLEALGIGDDLINEWDEFWKDNHEEFPPGFDPDNNDYNMATYGFDLRDPDTWYNPLLPDTWPEQP